MYYLAWLSYELTRHEKCRFIRIPKAEVTGNGIVSEQLSYTIQIHVDEMSELLRARAKAIAITVLHFPQTNITRLLKYVNM